MIGIVWTDLR